MPIKYLLFHPNPFEFPVFGWGHFREHDEISYVFWYVPPSNVNTSRIFGWVHVCLHWNLGSTGCFVLDPEDSAADPRSEGNMHAIDPGHQMAWDRCAARAPRVVAPWVFAS